MKKLITITYLCLVAIVANAQIQHGGSPINWQSKTTAGMDIPFVKTAPLDMASIIAEDAVVDQYKETPYRFGVDVAVNYNFFEMAEAKTRKNGDKIWRMGIHCPDATSINFVFGEYNLPEGGELFVWNADRTKYIGSFTNGNNKEFGSLAIGLVHDDKVIIEYIEPASVSGQALLSISQISHGYRPVINKWEEEKGPFGNSGSCNMNVNCDDGNDWQEEKRGVALILNGGSAWCTGSLINTTANDGTPYFLTAAHCDATESAWVFYFNHEYAGCDDSGEAPTDQSVSGGTQVASTAPSDAHLVLLSSDVPSDYEPYFNGWDATGGAATLGIGIHHPAGDVKKLAFDDDPLTITEYLGATEGAFDHWRIEEWERLTTTEGGSSGSPLFDQNHRIIGQLHGGYAACGNSIDDYYGAMHTSFPFLSEYLDPAETGNMTTDGYGPYDITYANDVQAGSITGMIIGGCSPEPFTAMFTLKNNGTNVLTAATITPSFNGTAQSVIEWTGSLAQDESEQINLGTFNTMSGSNNITVTVTTAVDDNANNNESSVSFDGAASEGTGAGTVNISLTTDDYGSETTWELKDGAGVVVLQGGPYDNNLDISESHEIVGGEAGCYEFTIFDSFGDGICCGFGTGSYSVSDMTGTVLFSGGEFAEASSHLFEMTTASGINESEFSRGITVYPNPVEETLNVVFAEQADYTIEVFNLMGELVFTTNNNNSLNLELDVTSYAAGMYILRINGESNIGIKTFTVK